MKIEDRYILSIIKKDDFIIPKDYDFDIDYFIEQMMKQKIYLYCYEKIIDNPYFKSKREIFFDKFEKIKKKKILFNICLYKILKVINESNISYFLYKGYILEKFIYDKKFVRQYNDIDIYTEKIEDIGNIKNVLKKNFICEDYDEENTDFLGETKIVVFCDGNRIEIEFKTNTHFCNVKDIENHIVINNGNLKIKTFSLEITFIQLCLYFYMFTENILMLEIGKNKLQSAVDLYNFIKKFEKEIDFMKVINYSIKYNKLHEIRLAIINVSKMFNDIYMHNKYKNIFNEKLINYNYDDILDKGRINWNISIEDRFIYSEEIFQFLKKYCYGEFLISNSNNDIYDGSVLEFVFNDKKYKYKFDVKDKISIIFDSENFLVDNDVLFIQLFCYRKSGEYILPYIPITIRNEESRYIYSRMPLSYLNNYNYQSEKDLDISKFNQVKITKMKGKTTIEINLLNMPYNININDAIGINMCLFHLENDKIKNYGYLKKYYDLPLILKRRNYD